MQVELFAIIIFLFCIYFYFENQSIKFEIIVLIGLIIFGPDIMYLDLANYILDIEKDFPYLYSENLRSYLLIAYPLCYSFLYYYSSKILVYKEHRLALIVVTFATLGFNQLFLCFAILLFLIQHSIKNKILRGLIIVLSLYCHISVLVLFVYYLYKYNKKFFIIIMSTSIIILYIIPDIYLLFDSYDERIRLYHELEMTRYFLKYSFRAHIYLHLMMLIISLLHRNIYLILFVVLTFVFSIVAQDLHAVFVARFIEIMYILFIIILSEKHLILQYKKILVSTLTLFFMAQLLNGYLYNSL